MKWFVLFFAIAGASALTIRQQGEDNVAMESHESRGGRKNRGHTEHPLNRQRQHQSLQDTRSSQSEALIERTPYFTNVQGDGLGFSSFVEHQDDSKIIQDGSNMEIKKVAPKSTVSFQMFSGPKSEGKQQHDSSPPIIGKNKYNPPKHFHESLPGYKKGNAVSPYKVPINPISIKETPELSPSVIVNQHKPLLTTASHFRKPTETPAYKVKEAPISHQQHDLGAAPIHFVESNVITIEGQNNKWKTLGNGVEVSTASEDFTSKQRKARKPNEPPKPHYSSPLFDHLHHEERYKSERFDHQKALQGSISFNLGNAIGVDSLNTNYQPQQHHQTSVGSNKETVSHHYPTKSLFNYPLLTEEEFKKNFGKHPRELRPTTLTFPKKTIVKRIPFDHRVQGKRQLRHNNNSEVQHAHSFIHFNDDGEPSVYPRPQKEPRSVYGTSNIENIDLTPSNLRNGFPIRSPTEITSPQQFSVSASYQIDKGFY